MKNKVIYLVSGPAHLPYLATSLYSLRKHYDGEVEVYAWPESYGIVSKMSEDKRLNFKAIPRTPDIRLKKNSQFVDKISLMQTIGADRAIYLDCDTMPVAPIDPLFEAVPEKGFVATQFGNWMSNTGQPKNRVSRLLGRTEIDQFSVNRTLESSLPSPNGGVFACDPKSLILRTWHEWTLSVRDLFIADETVLHVLFEHFYQKHGIGSKFRFMHQENESAHQSNNWMVPSYNCSPKFRPSDPSQVTLWHFHGDSNVRQNKCPYGVFLWFPVFENCLFNNIGFINEWYESVGNKYLDELLDKGTDSCIYCGHTTDHSTKCPSHPNFQF